MSQVHNKNQSLLPFQPPLEPEQLPLAFEWPSHMSVDDFLVDDSNREAFDLIMAWPEWPSGGLLLIGPQGAGKTHLSEIWRARSGAKRVKAMDVDAAFIGGLEDGGVFLIEDMDRIRLDEDAWFHLLNRVRQNLARVLLTASSAPEGWQIKRPDLLSRLRVLMRATLSEPDEALLAAVLVKISSDHQISLDPELLAKCVMRLPRSLGVARSFIKELSRISLIRQTKISRNLVTEVLLKFENL